MRIYNIKVEFLLLNLLVRIQGSYKANITDVSISEGGPKRLVSQHNRQCALFEPINLLVQIYY